MNYERKKETKYNHYLFQDEEESIFLIGVNKDIPEDEAAICLGSPIINYSSDFWNLYFKLSQANRQAISNTLQEFEEQEKKKTPPFINYYWDVFSDFLFAAINVTLYDIARDIKGLDEFSYNGNPQKTAYDRLDKLRNVKSAPREDTLKLLKEICALYLFSDDIFRTGNGVMYSLKEDYPEEQKKQFHNKYTIKAIDDFWSDKVTDTKTVLLALTGLSEDDLIETRVQIAGFRKFIDKDKEEFIIKIMKELYNKQ